MDALTDYSFAYDRGRELSEREERRDEEAMQRFIPELQRSKSYIDDLLRDHEDNGEVLDAIMDGDLAAAQQRIREMVDTCARRRATTLVRYGVSIGAGVRKHFETEAEAIEWLAGQFEVDC